MTGCPVGAAQGWVCQEVSVVEYSQPYPTASTHIENSHLLHMSTHLRFLVVHTPVGQENTRDLSTNQVVIPLFSFKETWGFWIASLQPLISKAHFFLFFFIQEGTEINLFPLTVYASAEINDY